MPSLIVMIKLRCQPRNSGWTRREAARRGRAGARPWTDSTPLRPLPRRRSCPPGSVDLSLWSRRAILVRALRNHLLPLAGSPARQCGSWAQLGVQVCQLAAQMLTPGTSVLPLLATPPSGLRLATIVAVASAVVKGQALTATATATATATEKRMTMEGATTMMSATTMSATSILVRRTSTNFVVPDAHKQAMQGSCGDRRSFQRV